MLSSKQKYQYFYIYLKVFSDENINITNKKNKCQNLNSRLNKYIQECLTICEKWQNLTKISSLDFVCCKKCTFNNLLV